MLIIAGWVEVAPEERDGYLDAHLGVLRRGRQAPGCHDLAISADATEPGRVNMFELWESEEALTAWRAVAGDPGLGSAIRAADVHKYHISATAPPF